MILTFLITDSGSDTCSVSSNCVFCLVIFFVEKEVYCSGRKELCQWDFSDMVVRGAFYNPRVGSWAWVRGPGLQPSPLLARFLPPYVGWAGVGTFLPLGGLCSEKEPACEVQVVCPLRADLFMSRRFWLCPEVLFPDPQHFLCIHCEDLVGLHLSGGTHWHAPHPTHK